MSAVDEVRRANRALYRAFESLRLDEMDRVWSHEDAVSCIHPGWPAAIGWPAVLATWRTIFANTRDMRFRITDETIDVRGDLAWVICIERVSSGAAGGVVLATNVLRREGDGWKIVHHHGSAIAPELAPEPDASSTMN